MHRKVSDEYQKFQVKNYYPIFAIYMWKKVI